MIRVESGERTLFLIPGEWVYWVDDDTGEERVLAPTGQGAIVGRRQTNERLRPFSDYLMPRTEEEKRVGGRKIKFLSIEEVAGSLLPQKTMGNDELLAYLIVGSTYLAKLRGKDSEKTGRILDALTKEEIIMTKKCPGEEPKEPVSVLLSRVKGFEERGLCVHLIIKEEWLEEMRGNPPGESLVYLYERMEESLELVEGIRSIGGEIITGPGFKAIGGQIELKRLVKEKFYLANNPGLELSAN